MTIHELLIKVIYDTYYERKKKGLISKPWPRVYKYGVLKNILKHHESDHEDEDDEEANMEPENDEDFEQNLNPIEVENPIII